MDYAFFKRNMLEKLFADVAKNISDIQKTEVVICSPFVYLEKLKKLSLSHSHMGEARKYYESPRCFFGEILVLIQEKYQQI